MRFLLAALLLLPSVAWAQKNDDTFSCPGIDGKTYTINSSNNEERRFGDPGIYDARGATIVYDPTVANYPIDNRDDFCLKGGAFVNTADEDLNWHDAAKEPNTAATIGMYVDTMVWDGVRIHNAADAFRPDRVKTAWWEIRNSWISYNRDDCIENDYFASGLVEDSLFDGCYVFLSSRNGISDIPRNTVTVQNSLIRMQKMPGPYGHPDSSVMGLGSIFKYQSQSPDLVLMDNIFLIEGCGATKWNPEDCGHPEFIGFFPDTKLQKCRGNVIVWRGDGEFPGDIPNDPSCVTVTKDISVWNEARDRWLVNHPKVARISGLDDPVVVADRDDANPSTEKDIADGGNSNSDAGDDSEAPTITLLSPSKLVQRKSDQVIEVAAEDNVGIMRVEISIDGHPYAVLEDTWLVDWSVPAKPNASYEISARAVDLSGNHSTKSIRVFATR